MIKLRYPVFFIHGTGFRDRRHLSYWGRIPKLFEKNGIRVGYGNQDSWGTVEDNAATVYENLVQFMHETGFEKVNIIAHSKGGLEARYLASTLGGASLIASITTVSTPHHGSKSMDLVLKLPSWLLRASAAFVNLWFRLLGDKSPNFQAACRQFTSAYAAEFNLRHPDVPGIYYQSYATVMNTPRSDMLMVLPSLIVGKIEGRNDGLVTPASAAWTNFKGVWESATNRGISHADAVDLRRRSFTKKAFPEGVTDICDCYLSIVRTLEQLDL